MKIDFELQNKILVINITIMYFLAYYVLLVFISVLFNILFYMLILRIIVSRKQKIVVNHKGM